MHDLMLAFVRDAPHPRDLARMPLDDGALVALFHRDPHPRWIAKTAAGEDGQRRLRREAWALGTLEPWAHQLGIPRILGWSDAPPAGADPAADSGAADACLIQSGLPGRTALSRRAYQWRIHRPWAPLPPPVRAAIDWLARWQCLVPPPRACSLAELADHTRTQIARDRATDAVLAPLADALLPQCPNHFGDRRAVPVHGDFWYGNLLVDTPGRLNVVDWCGFDAGTGIEDLCTLLATLPCRRGLRAVSALDAWRAMFFLPGQPRAALRAWAEQIGYPAPCARAAFYLFLLRRLRWELGLALQARSPEERRRAAILWAQKLAWLEAHRYPDPFSGPGGGPAVGQGHGEPAMD